MVNAAGVETDSMVPDLSWKMPDKGRRSRKPNDNARSIKSGVKLAKRSPNRVGDFSCSDSYKFGEAVSRQQVFNKNEHIPIKKRRLCRQYSSPPKVHSGYYEEARSPESLSTPKQSEEHTLLDHMNSDSYSGGKLHITDGLSTSKSPSVIKDEVMDAKMTEITNEESYKSGDFSGIALLAAAACADRNDRLHWDLNTSMDSWEQPHVDTVGINVSKNVICNEMQREKLEAEIPEEQRDTDIFRDNLEKCMLLKTEDGELVRPISPKIDRLHWDLNTSMDSWGQPRDDTVGINVSNNVIYNEEQRDTDIFRDNLEKCMPLTHMHLNALPPVLKTEQNKGAPVCSLNPTHVEEISVSEQDIGSTPITITADSDVQFEHKELIPKSAKSCTSSDEDQGSLHDSRKSDNTDVSQGDLGQQPIGSEDVSGFQAGNDSPFEDGELRGSVLCPWEGENDGGYEMECVDYGTDGDDLHSDDHSGSEVVAAGSQGGTETKNSSASICQEADLNKIRPVKNTGKQFSRGDSHDGGKKGSDPGSGTTVQHQTGKRDRGTGSNTKGKLQSYIDGPLHLDANKKETVLLQKHSTHEVGGSYSRPKREFSPERYARRYRSAHYTGDRNVIRNFAASTDKFGETDIHGYQHPMGYSSRVAQRSISGRRSSIERDDCLEVHRRRPPMREEIIEGSRRHTHQIASRSRSRSRSQRERTLRTRPSLSPDSRMERTRAPFQKLSRHAAERGEGFEYSTRYQNSGWSGSRNFTGSNHLRQRFNDVGPCRVRSDDYFRPATNYERFPPVASSARRFKLDNSYKYERRECRDEMMENARHFDYDARRHDANDYCAPQTAEHVQSVDRRSTRKSARDVSS